MQSLLSYERKLWKQGYGFIAGVDEAGRGPLAGPVTAAAVVMPKGLRIPGVDDSKKLSSNERERLFEIIIKKALAWNISYVDEEEIDRINILQATITAMRKAVLGLNVEPDYVLVDFVHIAGLLIPQFPITKGDTKSHSIASASILAKVWRDRKMQELDKQYPEYGFAKHKGYPTALHYAKLKEHGISPVHRKSFLKGIGG